MIMSVNFNLKVCFNHFKFYDNNVILINKIMKFFLIMILIIPFFNTPTQECNLKIQTHYILAPIQSKQSYYDDRFHPSLFKERITTISVKSYFCLLVSFLQSVDVIFFSIISTSSLNIQE